MPVKAIIALGSNLKEPKAQIRLAMREIAKIPSTLVLAESSLYKTAPVGMADQPDFINACMQVETFLSAVDLFKFMVAIERRHGRVRNPAQRNGPRTLDLDLVVFGDEVINAAPHLVVPHPRLAERAFVLLPLAEIAPNLNVPGYGVASELAAAIDKSGVERL